MHMKTEAHLKQHTSVKGVTCLNLLRLRPTCMAYDLYR